MLSSTSSSVTYQGNGATTAYPFDFTVLDATHLVVTVTDTTVTPNGVTILNSGQYTASGIPGAGTVTVTPALAVGQALTIARVVPNTQPTQIPNQGAFLPKIIEGALDYVTMQIQQLAEIASRAVLVPVGSGLTAADYLVTIQTAQNTTVASASASAASAAIATTHASAAATSRTACDADTLATAADRAATHADKLAADADAVATAADRAAVASDKTASAASASAAAISASNAHADKLAADADAVATAADRAAVASDKTASTASASAAAISASNAHASEVAAAASAVAASAAASGGAVKISASDTTSDYLSASLVAGSNIALTVLNSGLNETLRISVSGLSAVATSGSYADLSSKPTLGTVAALAVDTDATLAANSDTVIPSQKAVRAYVAANSGPDLTPDVGQLYLAFARLDSPTSPNVGGTQVADEFDDASGIGSLGGGTVASGYLGNPSGAPTSLTSGAPSGSATYTGYAGADRTWSIPNSVSVSKLGAYSTSAATLNMIIVRRDDATHYTSLYYGASWSHPGGGWADYTLPVPFATPSTGTLYAMAWGFGAGANTSGTSISRGMIGANPSSVGTQYAATEDSSTYTLALRASYGALPANITTISNAYTAASAPATISFVVEYQDVSGSGTLNTDFIASASRDGATWTAFTLTDFGPSPISGARVLKGSISVAGQPSGTTIKWKIATANNKEIRVHGLWMQWK